MIDLQHISKYFFRGTPNETRALDDLSLHIAEEEFTVVIGSNGSGKSTLLNIIAGAARVDAGTVVVDGTDVTSAEAHRRARFIGRVFQNPFSGTAPSMTIAENLRLAALRGLPKKLSIGLNAPRIRRLRERCAELGMGLEDRMQTPIGLLSGGQRQALTLLMATLGERGILLLDEHTAALDPRSAQQVMAITEGIVSRNRLTTLMVTHDMEQATRYGSRLVMMERGRIAIDVAGEAKKGITTEMLLAKFAEARKALASE